MIVVVRVGELIVPLICERCGYHVPVVVGDEASEMAGEVGMAGHQCRPAEKEQAS